MKLRTILLILCGVVLGVVALKVYGLVRPRTAYFWAGPGSDPRARLVNDLQDEISNQRKNAIVVAASRVGPAVASVTVIQTRIVTSGSFASPFADQFFDDFFRDFFPPRRYKEKIQSLGSAVIVSSNGYVITNEHLVANATEIKVTLPDARQFDARIIGTDRTSDVALLKIDGRDLPYATLGNSDDLIIGEWVIALGNPFGFLLEDAHPTVTVGVVSALRRSMKSRGQRAGQERIYKDMIQTDAAINPGNSGGPLVNIMGEVIGMNTFIFSSGGGSEGVGFALPISSEKHIITELKAHGKRREVWHGIYVQELTPELAAALKVEKKGILVSSVEEGSPADRAGLKPGDRIVEALGKPMNRPTDWEGVEAKLVVGDTLSLEMLRGGAEMTSEFVVKEYSPQVAAKRLERLGLTVQNVNPLLKKSHNLMRDDGVVVAGIKRNSLGERIGLREGDVILQWGGQPVRNTDDLLSATRELSGDITIIIDRKGMLLEVSWRI